MDSNNFKSRDYGFILLIVCQFMSFLFQSGHCLVPALNEFHFEDVAYATVSRSERAVNEDPVRPTCAPGVVVPRTRVDSKQHLTSLRKLMKENNVDAYIVPRSDAHGSEYTAEYDRRRSWVSGFDGSYGYVAITKDSAALWTDGRYFLQAEEQLDCNWKLMKIAVPGTPNITNWLISKLRKSSNVVADPKLIKQSKWLVYKEELRFKGINLISNHVNLIDEIWNEKNGRPSESKDKLLIHEKRFSGESWEAKLRKIRTFLFDNKADCLILSMLDEIAWLFNLRGNDVPYNPMFKSYVVVAKDFIRLYVDLEKVTDEVKDFLKSDGCSSKNCVSLVEYSDVWTDLKETLNPLETILITSDASYALYETVPQEKMRIVESPIILMKTVKNPTEVEGMKKSHIRDSAVIIDFISLLEKEVEEGKRWDEIEAAKYLSKLRSKQRYNRGESFETISAFGSNGAVIHYKPNHITNKIIDQSSIYLLDSGGQYLDGTTDITRSFHFGEPNKFHRETYTRVLMGSIDLANLKFPKGVTDIYIDIIARSHLYQVGLDYNHGTGHGIGSFSNIHEPKIRIRKPISKNSGTVLLPNMFMSDEPGYYEDNSFGIRLETTVMVKNMTLPNNFNNIPYYGFETIALVPFELKLIDVDLLSKTQIQWLNDYHEKCRRVIGDFLNIQGKERAYRWLLSKTKPIQIKEPSKCEALQSSVPAEQEQAKSTENIGVKFTLSKYCTIILIITSFFSLFL